MSSPFGTSVGTNYHKDVLKAWSPENKDSNIPRLQYGDQYTTNVSDRFLTDASYLNISEHQRRLHAAVEDHPEVRRTETARLPGLRQCGLLVEAPGLDPRYRSRV